MSKKILMIAGPNGAGKTTTSLELLNSQSVFYEFVNADEIARGLAPLHPESMALTASKLMLKRLKELLEACKSFAFETTAAGINYVKYLKMVKSKGYEINITFLWLASPKQAVKRVAQRVQQGGHHVPEDTIVRRYYAGLRNFLNIYLPIADSVLVVDSSSEEPVKKFIAKKNVKGHLEILDRRIWEKMERESHGC